MSDDIIEEISRFDNDYSPKDGFLPGPEVLHEGPLVVEIVQAELTRTFNTRDPILRWTLRVVGGVDDGVVFARTSFFGRQEDSDRLGGEMRVLGFDSHLWLVANRRPFSRELEKALPKLRGKRFRGRKTTTESAKAPGKWFHNLNIDSPVRASSAPPPPNGVAPPRSRTAAPPTTQIARVAPTPDRVTDSPPDTAPGTEASNDSIPF